MLNVLNAVFTIALGLLALFAGWFNFIDDVAPATNFFPRLGSLGFQVSRIQPVGWWVLGSVLACMVGGLIVQAIEDRDKSRQTNELLTATRRLNSVSDVHDENL